MPQTREQILKQKHEYYLSKKDTWNNRKQEKFIYDAY